MDKAAINEMIDYDPQGAENNLQPSAFTIGNKIKEMKKYIDPKFEKSKEKIEEGNNVVEVIDKEINVTEQQCQSLKEQEVKNKEESFKTTKNWSKTEEFLEEIWWKYGLEISQSTLDSQNKGSILSLKL